MRPPRSWELMQAPDEKTVLLRLTAGAMLVNYAFDPGSDFGKVLTALAAELNRYEAAYSKETSVGPPPPLKPGLAIVQSIPKGLKPPGNGAT